jgi:DNA polymerase III epsilon subunit-like protein
MVKVIILDTETTGLTASDEVLELAYIEIDTLAVEQGTFYTDSFDFIKESINSNTAVSRYRPVCAINPYAFAVHGIGLTDLVGKPNSSTIYLPKDITYMIGQNISYDKRMLGQTNPELLKQLDSIRYICTLTLARVIDKQMGIGYENHKLDTLVKHYFPEHSETLAPKLHSAGNDVLKTYLVLLKLVEHLPAIETWDELYSFQESMSSTVKKER